METRHARAGVAAWSMVAIILIAIWCLQLSALISLIPKLEGIYRDLGIRLPWLTELLVGVIRWIMAWAPLLLIAVAALAIGLWIALRSRGPRRMMHRICACMPWSQTGAMERIRRDCFLVVAERLEAGASISAAIDDAVQGYAPADLAARLHVLRGAGTLDLAQVLRQTDLCDEREAHLVAQQNPTELPEFLRFLAEVHEWRQSSYPVFLHAACAALLVLNLLTLVMAVLGLALPFCHNIVLSRNA